jgi:anti-anti-sigma factor
MAPISVTLAQRDPPTAVVALMGEHDAYSSERLESEVKVLLEARRHVVVDLHETLFIDSTTLSVLLAAQKQADQAGLRFVVVLGSRDYSQVHQILELTGLVRAFAIYPKLDDALAAVRSGDADNVAA